MSQLRQTAKPSSEQSTQFNKLDWADFVQVVLTLTIEAYQAMRRSNIVQRGWEENVFTIRLAYDFIHPLTFDMNLPIRLWPRTKTHTDAMKSGEQPTIKAQEIDLLLHDVWEQAYHTKHFVWEAKRVGDKRVDADYGDLNSEYVNEAIYRFIRGEYASQVSDAGVLGYVLAGEVGNIVADINQSMGNIRKNPPLPPSNQLRLVAPINDFQDIYQSHHARVDNSILLHHLFLTFDFARNRS